MNYQAVKRWALAQHYIFQDNLQQILVSIDVSISFHIVSLQWQDDFEASVRSLLQHQHSRVLADVLTAKHYNDGIDGQRLLGHVDLVMTTRYVQDVSKQTDRVIENSRKTQ